MGHFGRKIAILLLLMHVLFGTVVADWFLHGKVTRGYGLWLCGGGLLAALLFWLGIRLSIKRQSFLGFLLWQWTSLTSLSFAAGIVARVFML
jgi:hypothetical protein